MEFRFAPGTAFADCIIVAPLGQGCVGETYRARKAGSRVDFALKIAWQHLAGAPGFAFAMQRRARILQRLRHPYIVGVIDSGISKGLPFWVCEYVPGPRGEPLTLREHIAELNEEKLKIDEDDVIAIAQELIEALAALHAFRDKEECPDGFALGDFRPADILLDQGSKLRLGDPGLSAVVRAVTCDKGEVSPAVELDYMSPEVRDGYEPDARSDIYSFGALIHELLTGQKFAAGLPPPSQIRKGIRTGWDGLLLKRCLAANSEDRLADMTSLRKVIGSIASSPRPKVAISEKNVVPQTGGAIATDGIPRTVTPGAGGIPVKGSAPEKMLPPLPKTTSPAAMAVAEKTVAPPEERITKSANNAEIPVAAPAAAKSRLPVVWIASGVLLLVIAALFAIASFSSGKDAREEKRTAKSLQPAPAKSATAPANKTRPPVVAAKGPPVTNRNVKQILSTPVEGMRETAPAAKGPEAGKPWPVADLGVTMRWIPPGRVLLGSSAGERLAAGKYLPTSEVHVLSYEVEKEAEVSAGFWLGGTEVTVAAWKKFIAANPAFKTDAEKKGSALSVMADGSLGPTAGANWRTPVPGQVAGDLLPVTCVSPRDAAAFCVWLTKSEHDAHRLPAEFQFRLPTELEWEYACRGGEKNRSAFWWGDDPADGAGRINAAGDEFTKKHSATEPFNFSWSDPFVHAAPVNSSGEKGLNAFGLADMLGNVWECVSKPLLPKYPFAWRGGSFAEGPGIVRCASARHRYNDTPSANAGFRLCLARDPAP